MTVKLNRKKIVWKLNLVSCVFNLFLIQEPIISAPGTRFCTLVKRNHKIIKICCFLYSFCHWVHWCLSYRVFLVLQNVWQYLLKIIVLISVSGWIMRAVLVIFFFIQYSTICLSFRRQKIFPQYAEWKYVSCIEFVPIILIHQAVLPRMIVYGIKNMSHALIVFFSFWNQFSFSHLMLGDFFFRV